MPVVGAQEDGPIALVKEPIIDPENGGILGLSIVLSKKIIASADIRGWDLEEVRILDKSILIEREELVRLKNFSKGSTSVYAKPVFKQDGKFLGVIHDFVIDTEVGQLTQIYVAKKILFFTLEKRVVDYREIVEILEDRIVVKNDLRGTKETVKDFFKLRSQIKMNAAT